MLSTAAETDYMVKDCGDAVVFSRGASTVASTFGILEKKQVLGHDGSSMVVVGRDITLAVRDGTQGTTTLEDVATINGVAYRVRDLGLVLADGTRVLTLAGG
jgi:hypothetical protein